MVNAIGSLLGALLRFFKKIMTNPAIQFDSYHPDFPNNKSENKVILIRLYNKTKKREAFRFSGVLFSDKKFYRFKRSFCNGHFELLSNQKLMKDQNPKDFYLVDPFEFSDSIIINYDFFVDQVTTFLLEKKEKVKNKFLKEEYPIFLTVVFELDTKKNYASLKFNKKNIEYQDIYNDLVKKLKEKTQDD